jgi:hypothetical protein
MKHTYSLSMLFVLGLTASIVAAQPPTMPPGRMAGLGPAMMGHDSSTMAEMGVIYELMVNHDRINRTVTNLTDGIRTVTESDDPQMAKIIKEHVSSMDQRVRAGNDPGSPIESPALHSIFRNADKVHTSIQTTANGVVVVQTSTDPQTVAALQKHASEVSDLVKGGMAAMREAMMNNGMHGGMMGNPPNSGTPEHFAVTPQAHDQDATAQSHDQHHADVNGRGDQVMGFDHEKTTHHFHLMSDGGVIEVEANDQKDIASSGQIREHLNHIAQMFADGDFTAPMLIHAQTPPGVAVMKRLKAEIQYRFEETVRGGQIRITTANLEALAAIHEFLRFQITDHGTSDSGAVEGH